MKIYLVIFLLIRKVHVFPVKMSYCKCDNSTGKVCKTGLKGSLISDSDANFHRNLNEMRDVISMTRFISSYCHGVQ